MESLLSSHLFDFFLLLFFFFEVHIKSFGCLFFSNSIRIDNSFTTLHSHQI